MLRDNSAKIQEQAASSTIGLPQLQAAFQNIYATMDAIYTLLVNAGHGPCVRDGVDQATVPASDVFPYMAPPNPVLPSELPIAAFLGGVGMQTEAHGGAR